MTSVSWRLINIGPAVRRSRGPDVPHGGGWRRVGGAARSTLPSFSLAAACGCAAGVAAETGAGTHEGEGAAFAAGVAFVAFEAGHANGVRFRVDLAQGQRCLCAGGGLDLCFDGN